MADQLCVGDLVALRGGSGPTMVVGEIISSVEVRLYWFNLRSAGEYGLETCFLPIGALDKVEVPQ